MKARKSKLSKKFIAIIMSISMALGFLSINPRNDNYIRDRIVLLTSDTGSCTGEQVRAPSGTDYILSAAHCIGLAKNGYITVTTERGRVMQRRVIAEDVRSDLLLIEGIPNLKGLPIAKSSKRGDKVTTFTRGSGMPTYKTEGVIITDQLIRVGIKSIDTEQDIIECESMPKNKVYIGDFGLGTCVLVVYETVSTALIVPGSSGGAAFNEARELIGVASATNGKFGFFVRLKDIQNFIKNY